MEAERHTNRQTDGRDRLAGEVLGIEDDHVAEIAFRVWDTYDKTQPSSSAVAPGFRTKTGSAVIRPGP